MFLSDQGRDAIIIKRIITFEHFPAIGAPTSIGGVFLGPFYYYLVSPFLALFNFNPVGLAFGVAFLSIIGLIAIYITVKNELDKKTALLFLILAGFSYIQIENSRFSWNPNLLPFFSFFTLYFFYKTLKDKKYLFAVLFGSFLSFCFQLHYLSALLIIPILFFSIIHLLKTKKKTTFILQIICAFISFLFWSIPLILFDIRHNFLNGTNFIKLFTEQNMVQKASFLSRLIEVNNGFFSALAKTQVLSIIALIVLIFILLVLFSRVHTKKYHERLFILIHAVNFIFFMVFFTFLNSPNHPHYYGQIYLSFFLIISFILMSFQKCSAFKNILIIFFVIIYIFFNAKNYNFLFNKSQNHIKHSKKVAEFLSEKIDNKPFNISTWPVDFSEDNYLYFLELKGKIPAKRENHEVTNQMFVLCNTKPCLVINSPSWNISMFGKAKIDKIWNIENIEVFKLIHDR